MNQRGLPPLRGRQTRSRPAVRASIINPMARFLPTIDAATSIFFQDNTIKAAMSGTPPPSPSSIPTLHWPLTHPWSVPSWYRQRQRQGNGKSPSGEVALEGMGAGPLGCSLLRRRSRRPLHGPNTTWAGHHKQPQSDGTTAVSETPVVPAVPSNPTSMGQFDVGVIQWLNTKV
jgi:hypothetical protein